MQVKEVEPGLYTVQWRVPKTLPPRAAPEPDFPETCSVVGEATVQNQQGAWLLTQEWSCETALAGQPVGVRFPYPDLALTTVIRVDLLSGDRFAHVLSSGEGPWRLPEGTAAPDFVKDAQRAVSAGARHVAGSLVHIMFLLVLGLFGGLRQPIRLTAAFSIGHLVGVALASMSLAIAGSLSEIGLLVGIVTLARQALEPSAEQRRLWLIAAIDRKSVV